MISRLRWRTRTIILCVSAVILGVPFLAALSVGVFLTPIRHGVSLSREVYDCNGTLLRLTLSPDQKYRRWTPLEQISPGLREATLLEEDQYFYYHPGVNPIALLRAFYKTYLGDGPQMGGSTISMQLARIIYRINSHSILGKLKQIAAALWLELTRSKSEILEYYLNLVPYGGNIEGIGAASLVYLGKKPAELALSEIISLCVIPKSPVRRNPFNSDREGCPLQMLQARDRLLDKWLRKHPEDGQARLLQGLKSLEHPKVNLAFYAPHFCDSMLNDFPQARIDSTLDLKMQQGVERQVRAYVKSRKADGLSNAAVLLVDAADMGVRAEVGAADFFDSNISGQVNVANSLRSPGSALKPFIYALAFDQGLLHPMSLLKDSPFSFSGFNPENFDGDFHGPVHAKDALIKSRNIPAVRLVLQLKEPSFYYFLKNAGLSLREESYYGLTLALGGEEVTMRQVAELYGMLINGGVFRPLRRTAEEPRTPGRSLLSPEAAYITMKLLQETKRPEQNLSRQWLRNPQLVAWKTGTSSGFRDAWSVGVFGHYIVVVWIGNADGRPNQAFVGINAAAPLMFRVIDAVRALEPGMYEIKPPYMRDLRTVKVCPISGKLPGNFCKATVDTLFIAGKSPIQTCDIHRQVEVDEKTGYSVCPEFRGKRKNEIYEFWPSDLSSIFREAGISRREPPPLHPDCIGTAAFRGAAPAITSPRPGVAYVVRLSGEARDRIPFTAVTDAGVQRLYWFVDGNPVGNVANNKTFFWKASPGNFTIRVLDDHGRAASAELKVEVEQ